MYSGLILATVFSGLIAAGVFSALDGVRGLAGWRWLFVIDGAASFCIGVLAIFVLPDFPETPSGSAKWLLTPDERAVAVERMRRDRVSVEEGRRSVWYGLMLAVLDYRTLIFTLMSIANHAAYGFNYFYPSIVKGFGLGSTTITLLLTAPPYLLAAVFCLGFAYSADRRENAASTSQFPFRYFASFLYICGCFSANALVFSWAAASLSQTAEKRAAATAMINSAVSAGEYLGCLFLQTAGRDEISAGNAVNDGICALSVATCLVMRWSLGRANRKILSEYAGKEEAPKLFMM